MSRKKKFHQLANTATLANALARGRADGESLADAQREVMNRDISIVGPPRLYADEHVSATDDEISSLDRIRGYLDCLDGLIQDGYPDPRFIEHLCGKVGRDVPPPFFDRVMDENATLRRQIVALEERE